jgi:uncharacterized protein YjiS (DUF1127 family)
MRKLEQYLVTIDTIYPDQYRRESPAWVARELVPPAPMPVRRTGLAVILDICGNWLSRRHGRRALLEMTDEQLSDIGISRCGALSEAAKSRLLL